MIGKRPKKKQTNKLLAGSCLQRKIFKKTEEKTCAALPLIYGTMNQPINLIKIPWLANKCIKTIFFIKL